MTRTLTFVRSATVILDFGGVRLVVDPMLDDLGARPRVENTNNDRRNPLVPLPMPIEEIVRDLDAILVTHLRRDHFDDGAATYLPRDMPLFCQPEDEQRLRALDFEATPLADSLTFRLTITRTSGQRGHGEVARTRARQRVRNRRRLRRRGHDLVRGGRRDTRAPSAADGDRQRQRRSLR
jgi:hypothetical protein